MTEQDAVLAIQDWFNGTNARSKMEEERVISNVKKGENGSSTFKAASNFRRSDTVKMSKIIPNIGSSELSFLLKTTSENNSNASLKGIIDIQGRMSESFTLLVNMGPRQQEFDKDYIKYRTYLALHVDHQKAWFSIKRDGMKVNLKI